MQPAIFSLKILMLSSLIPDRHARQQAIGMFGGLVSVAAAAGPVLGGVLVGDFGWRSIFLINLPVGLYGICSGYRPLPAALPSRLRALDFTGQVLAMATLGCLSWVLIQLPEQEWGQSALPLMALAFFLFVGNLSAAVNAALGNKKTNGHRPSRRQRGLCRNDIAKRTDNPVGLYLNGPARRWRGDCRTANDRTRTCRQNAGHSRYRLSHTYHFQANRFPGGHRAGRADILMHAGPHNRTDGFISTGTSVASADECGDAF